MKQPSFTSFESPQTRRAAYVDGLRLAAQNIAKGLEGNDVARVWKIASVLRAEFGNLYPNSADDATLLAWQHIKKILENTRDAFASGSDWWNKFNGLIVY